MSEHDQSSTPGRTAHCSSSFVEPPAGTVGLLGGAFDPPHVGHLVVANEAQAQLRLERLLVVVTGEAPHKTVETPAPTRFRLAEIAFGGLENVEVSKVELEREGPSYTLDTVRWASEIYGETVFVVGADEFMGFLSWHQPESVLAATRLAVATRPGFPPERLGPVLAELRQPERVHFFSIPEIPISSRCIRRRVRQGLAIDDLVPQAVAREIRALRLYRDASGPDAVLSDEMKPGCEGS
jgi:nicotinate-nucleotide adenylyltransferase